MLNPVWSTACPDWAERLVDRRSIIPPPIFPEEAERALAIFKSLRVSDLPGKPTFGECADQWVFDYVAAVFGGYDADTGKQLIREYGLLISKKNTKSTLAAGIMLTALILCWREEEEHLILAPTREVADNAFKPAAGMVRADEELMAMFHVQDHIRTITHRITRNSLKVVAADTDTVSGKKAGRVLVDELWVFGKKAGAEAMFMEALGGQVSRDEGWVIFLTTQSDDPPAGVFKDKLDYWRNVRDGKIKDNKTLGVLFEFPPEMVASKAYLDPENFYITNPNLGRSVSKEWLEDQLKRYRDRQDGAFQQFLAKHLNIEIGMNLRSDRWPGADFWQQQSRSHITFQYLMEHSEVITAGIDGGGLDDLLGLAFIGRHKTTGEWMGWVHAWAHPSVLERRKEIAPRLRDFANDGDLTIIESMGEDVTELSDMVAHVHQLGLLDKVGADPAGIAAILDALEARGIPPEKLVGVSQGWLLIGSVKAVERRLASPQPNQSFVHADQPLMDWCVSNAKVVVSKAGYNISKAVSGTGKIDPVMALMDAAHLMALNPAAPKQSVYESRGIRFIRG